MEHVSIEGLATIMAFLANVGALCYHAGKVDARLRAVEHVLTNGLSEAVQEHGEKLSALEATCRERHGMEVSQ